MSSPNKCRNTLRILTNIARLPETIDGYRVNAGRIGSGEGLRGVLRAIAGMAKCDAIVLTMDAKLLMLLVGLRVLCPIGFRRAGLISVDIVLAQPDGRKGRIVAKLRAFLLRRVDLFILYMKKTEGYEQVYGIPKAKIRYVPFKVNFPDLVASAPERVGDYVLSCGRSNRDFETFCRAMSGLDIPAIILTPPSGEGGQHGTHIANVALPSNVQLIHDDGSAASWVAHLADARMLVLPISPGTMSPSGLSAYLVAMAMGKCVVISECPSSSGILTDGDNAVVVPTADPHAMQVAIRSLWNDDAWRDEIANRGRDYALALGGEGTLHANILHVVLESLGRQPVEQEPEAVVVAMPAGSIESVT